MDPIVEPVSPSAPPTEEGTAAPATDAAPTDAPATDVPVMDEVTDEVAATLTEEPAPIELPTDTGLEPGWFLVALISAMALTKASRWTASKLPGFSKLLDPIVPTMAVGFAVAVRAGAEVVTGEPMTWAVLGQGVAAGLAALATHAQARSLVKGMTSKKPPTA